MLIQQVERVLLFQVKSILN